MSLFSITDTLKTSLMFVGAEYFPTNLSDAVLKGGSWWEQRPSFPSHAHGGGLYWSVSTFTLLFIIHYVVREAHRAGRFIVVSLIQPGCLMWTPQEGSASFIMIWVLLDRRPSTSQLCWYWALKWDSFPYTLFIFKQADLQAKFESSDDENSA